MPDKIDYSQIRNVLRKRKTPLKLTLYTASGDQAPFSDLLADVARKTTEAAGTCAELREGEDAGEVPATPALVIASGDRGEIRYLALPEGPEAEPFEEALTGEFRGGEELPQETRLQLATLNDPADLQVFIASACPHCPQAVRAAHRLAMAGSQIRVTVIDAQRFPQLAERFTVKSVPTTVLDGDMALTGVIPATQLAAHILSRGSTEHAAARFASLIEGGNVTEGTERVLAGEADHFLTVWTKSATSSRIVLMTIAEEVLSQDPNALNGIVQGLISILAVEDAPLRGDTADLLGQIGHPDGLEALRPLLNDPVPDVAEIAAEALGLDD
jgi:hypothetical protein